MKSLSLGFLLLFAAAGGFFAYQKYAARSPAPATQAVDAAGEIAFTLPDLQGNPRSLADWDGQARIVNFWATWCAPCRREIPLLKKIQESGGEHLQVIGVAVDFPEDVAAYAEEADFNYPVLVGQEDAMAAVERAGYDFVGLPITLVLAADGTLLKMHLGEIHEPELDEIAAVLAQLAAGGLDNEQAREALARI